MNKPNVIGVPLEKIQIHNVGLATIAVVGNPNGGKSTLFNRLTGLRQKTANYPGVTVEKHVGRARLYEKSLELVDLPGTFALSTFSLDERITVDVLLGRMPGTEPPAGILAVVDATRLYQGLYLLQQLLELQLPVVVALTMTDVARRQGVVIDVEKLSQHLCGIPVCPVVATTGHGMEKLERALASLPGAAAPKVPDFWPALRAAEVSLRGKLHLDFEPRRIELERALIDGDTENNRVIASSNAEDRLRIQTIKRSLFGEKPPLAEEARHRYRWIRQVLNDVQTQATPLETISTRLVEFMERPVPATISFFVVMIVVFQAVFAWATPLMDSIDATAGLLTNWVNATLPAGALTSLLADGVIAGVGSVVIFLPQILILFLFIILLEDTGYLARAAFLMDRAMRTVGLSGQSVIPMLSSFACAVPGIMATRVIPNRRDRIATILAAPFMTCSARLPVYALLISAFVPSTRVGLFNIQGLVLFGLYMLGIVGGAGTALLLRKSALRGPKPSFMLALPEFRMPNWRSVLIKLLDRARIFLRRAGTVIFTVAVLVWALAYFPRSPEIDFQLAGAQQAVESTLTGEALDRELSRLDNEASAARLEQSWLGRAGKAVEPVFAPLGWDWRVSAAVIAGFPAREVVVAVLGTIYAVGQEADVSSLAERLRAARWPDGRIVFTLPMVLGLLVFYAWCLQCAATLAVIRRETNSWRWPIFGWAYMTLLGYLGALLIFQLGSAWT